jgi:hypothetical protein
MAALSGIGMLAVIENGEPRFRPLEFYPIDGEFWAASPHNLDHCEGQHVDLLFLNEGFDYALVQGVLRCSHQPGDYQRLQTLAHAYAPAAVIIKVIPQDAEVLSAYPTGLHIRNNH